MSLTFVEQRTLRIARNKTEKTYKTSDAGRAAARRCYHKNRDARLAYNRRWKVKNRELYKKINRNSHLKANYGITADEFDAMFEAQGAKCAVCKKDNHGGRGWVVDHCHSTERVRGVLCAKCNLGIGYFDDDPEVLASVIDYLGR